MFEEDIAHDHVCVLWKPVFLRSSDPSVIYREGKVGSRTEENDNSLTWREERREFWLLQSQVLAERSHSSDFSVSSTADSWNVLVKTISWKPTPKEVGWVSGKMAFASIRRSILRLATSCGFSRLDYCNCLLNMGTTDSLIQHLQKIQNLTAGLVLLYHRSAPRLD